MMLLQTLNCVYLNDDNMLATKKIPSLIIKCLMHWMFAKFRDKIKSLVLKKKIQWHVQIMGQQCKIVCHSTVWKGLFYSTHGRQITQWNSMLKDIAFKINLIIFVSFYFVGIELICALMRHSVCKALSYLCHNIKKLSGMEWFAYRSMFVSCEGVWHHRYWNS